MSKRKRALERQKKANSPAKKKKAEKKRYYASSQAKQNWENKKEQKARKNYDERVSKGVSAYCDLSAGEKPGVSARCISCPFKCSFKLRVY